MPNPREPPDAPWACHANYLPPDDPKEHLHRRLNPRKVIGDSKGRRSQNPKYFKGNLSMNHNWNF